MNAAGAKWQKPDRTLQDKRYMRLALALGERNLGQTWPNPSVGCVIVDESGDAPVIVAQGATQPGRRPHAERVALAAAGERARGRRFTFPWNLARTTARPHPVRTP